MKLFHATTASAAEKIMASGFEDATGSYGFLTLQLTGVWFAGRPLGISEGAKDDPVLGAPVFVIELDGTSIASYELVDSSPTYREW